MPRTIFNNDRSNHVYDQIAWFSEPDAPRCWDGIAYSQRAGSSDFIPHVYQNMSRNEVS